MSNSKKATTFQIDTDMYSYIYKEDGSYIDIMSLKPCKRLLVKLKDHKL